jgi:hypothetical protein
MCQYFDGFSWLFKSLMAVIPFGHLTVLSSNQTEGMTPSSSRPFSTQTALTHIILYAWLSENKKMRFSIDVFS